MNVDSHNSARGERISCTPDLAILIKNGTAIISGTACSSKEKRDAEAAVYGIAGVSTVYNLVKTTAE